MQQRLNRRSGQDRRLVGDPPPKASQRSGQERREETDRRDETDRRASQDQRGGQNRRQTQQSIDFPNRRVGNRRELSQRRLATRRDHWEEDIPVLEWTPEEEGAPVRKPRDLRPIFGIGALAALLPLLLLYFYFAAPEPQKLRRPVRSQIPVAKKKPPPQKVAKQAEEQTDPAGNLLTRLSQDILNIAPEIYSYIRLELVDETYIESGGSARNLKTGAVHSIEIFVKNKPWDSLGSTEKVHLLHRTFDLIKNQYPDITSFIKLKFEGERKDLELKFDDFDQG